MKIFFHKLILSFHSFSILLPATYHWAGILSKTDFSLRLSFKTKNGYPCPKDSRWTRTIISHWKAARPPIFSTRVRGWRRKRSETPSWPHQSVGEPHIFAKCADFLYCDSEDDEESVSNTNHSIGLRHHKPQTSTESDCSGCTAMKKFCAPSIQHFSLRETPPGWQDVS